MTIKSASRAILTIVATFLAPSAFGQQPTAPPPPFAPITISQSDYQSIQNWLGEQPAKFSIPVLTWLDGLERKAQEEAMKAAPVPPAAEGPKQ